MKKYRGFILDMDGTMIDNMKFHLKAWERTVKELGSPLEGEDLFKQLYGKNSEIIQRIFDKSRFSEKDLSEISYRKDAYYRELYAPYIKPVKGLIPFMEESNALSIPIAIATGGTKENIEFMIDRLQIGKLIKAIISELEVVKSKPDPETFLKAAQALELPAYECIVFEDVPMGIEAAARAGMKAVALLTSHKAQEFNKFDNVLKVVTDFTVIKPRDILES